MLLEVPCSHSLGRPPEEFWSNPNQIMKPTITSAPDDARWNKPRKLVSVPT